MNTLEFRETELREFCTPRKRDSNEGLFLRGVWRTVTRSVFPNGW